MWDSKKSVKRKKMLKQGMEELQESGTRMISSSGNYGRPVMPGFPQSPPALLSPSSHKESPKICFSKLAEIKSHDAAGEGS